jgi:hypothetical protein
MPIIMSENERTWLAAGLTRETWSAQQTAERNARIAAERSQAPKPTHGADITAGLQDAQERHASRVRAHDATNVAVYRLYTEHKSNLTDIIAQWFDGATIIQTVGLWRGQTEIGAIVEIIGQASDRARIIALARQIRDTNEQQCVLVLYSTGNGWQSLNVR